MSRKLCPKIILEGTRLTFKTEIAFALNEHPKIVGERNYRYHSPIISAEWCTFTNYPWGRGLINFLPEEESLALETYSTWIKLIELQKYYSWIVDRFHISTIVYQLIHHNKLYNFSWLEDRLEKLNFHLILLIRNEGSFESAKEIRLQVSGNPNQYNNIENFIREQKLFKEFFSKSNLKKIEIDISDNDIGRAVEEIAMFLERTGGLYANY